ncbi:MAG: hypothetical protein AB8H80_18435, partial [Planctomycetota bacterium]
MHFVVDYGAGPLATRPLAAKAPGLPGLVDTPALISGIIHPTVAKLQARLDFEAGASVPLVLDGFDEGNSLLPILPAIGNPKAVLNQVTGELVYRMNPRGPENALDGWAAMSMT